MTNKVLLKVQQIRLPSLPSEDLWSALSLGSGLLCRVLLSLLPADQLQPGGGPRQPGPAPRPGEDEEEEEMVQYILDIFILNENLNQCTVF